ncbi:S-adenosyl-L-methionine-dependent methyltransferase [Nemania serpens]|nr:S-adenosyl-L-methionine-dependent methyltransferase [Nemania serpens]
MNAPEFGVKFVSKQAVDPTPQLYDELVADSMEKLANAASAAVVAAIGGRTLSVSIGATAPTRVVSLAARSPSRSGNLHFFALPDDGITCVKGVHWPADAACVGTNTLRLAGGTFTLSLGNRLLFALPDKGVTCVKVIPHTFKPDRRRTDAPRGTRLPCAGLGKRSLPGLFQSVVEAGAFGKNWDRAIEIVEQEVRQTQVYRERPDGRNNLQVVANIAIVTK